MTVLPLLLSQEHLLRRISEGKLDLPVVRIDGRPVGNGAPGLIASALRRDFHQFAEQS